MDEKSRAWTWMEIKNGKSIFWTRTDERQEASIFEGDCLALLMKGVIDETEFVCVWIRTKEDG